MQNMLSILCSLSNMKAKHSEVSEAELQHQNSAVKHSVASPIHCVRPGREFKVQPGFWCSWLCDGHSHMASLLPRQEFTWLAHPSRCLDVWCFHVKNCLVIYLQIFLRHSLFSIYVSRTSGTFLCSTQVNENVPSLELVLLKNRNERLLFIATPCF